MIEDDLRTWAEQYEQMAAGGDEYMALLFDPIAFNEEHRPLKFERYRLSNEQLRGYAVTLTQIRKRISSKADDAAIGSSSRQETENTQRTRSGIPNSTKSRDIFGRS